MKKAFDIQNEKGIDYEFHDYKKLGITEAKIKQWFKLQPWEKFINKQGTTILLVEQNAKKALEISDFAYVLEVGSITFSGPSKEIAENPKVKEAYLGV